MLTEAEVVTLAVSFTATGGRLTPETTSWVRFPTAS